MALAEISQITATEVAETHRMTFLPGHLPWPANTLPNLAVARTQDGLYLRFEQLVYALTDHHSPDYNGGYWKYYQLSNGGWFICPPAGEYAVQNPENFYDGRMSGEALGIAICMIALSRLAFAAVGRETVAEKLSEDFHRLRDFALDHAEAGEIMRFTD